MKQLNDLKFYDRMAAQWWDETAKIYALKHLNSPRFQYFDRYTPNWQGLIVLDVGCGGGFTCEFLAQRGAIVAGVDQSSACIVAAQKHATETRQSIAYHHAHAEALPFAAHCFDVVICVDVLEHVADVGQTLAEIDRVLKPGGMFYFDTINRSFRSKLVMIWLLEDWLRQIPRGVHDWKKFIKPSELTKDMEALGFTKIEMAGFNIFGETLLENIRAYQHYRQTGGFKISINQDLSTMYIGKAQKTQTFRRMN